MSGTGRLRLRRGRGRHRRRLDGPRPLHRRRRAVAARDRVAQVGDEVGRRRRPLPGLLRQPSRHHRVDAAAELGPQRRGERWRLGDVRPQQRRLARLLERHLAGQALVGDGGERVDVALAPCLALDLLGRDVVERAEELPAARVAGVPHRLGQPEVGQIRPVGEVDEDVLGLDVAVREPGLVRGVERARHRRQDAQRARDVEVAGAEQRLEVAAADQPHGDVAALRRLAGVVHGDDVRVVEAGLHARLAPEAILERRVGAEVGLEDLQRDGAAERELRRLVDRAHAATAEQRLDAVAGDLRARCERCQEREATWFGRRRLATAEAWTSRWGCSARCRARCPGACSSEGRRPCRPCHAWSRAP